MAAPIPPANLVALNGALSTDAYVRRWFLDTIEEIFEHWLMLGSCLDPTHTAHIFRLVMSMIAMLDNSFCSGREKETVATTEMI